MLLAQIAEHIERGNPLAQTIFVCFEKALSLVRDDHLRNEIEMLLTEVPKQQLRGDGVQTTSTRDQPKVSVRETESRARRYRDYAEALRVIAADSTSSERVRSFQVAAAEYDQMAASLELIKRTRRALEKAREPI